MRNEYCKRRHLVTLLRDLGFAEVEMSGDHHHYALNGHKVSVVGGRDYVTANEALTTVRVLANMGFNRREIKARIKGKKFRRMPTTQLKQIYPIPVNVSEPITPEVLEAAPGSPIYLPVIVNTHPQEEKQSTTMPNPDPNSRPTQVVNMPEPLLKAVQAAIDAEHPGVRQPSFSAYTRTLIFEALEARIAAEKIPLAVIDNCERPWLFRPGPKPKPVVAPPAQIASTDLGQISALLMQTVELLSKLNVSGDNSSIVPPRCSR